MHTAHLFGLFILTLIGSLLFWAQLIRGSDRISALIWFIASSLTALGITLLFVGRV